MLFKQIPTEKLSDNSVLGKEVNMTTVNMQKMSLPRQILEIYFGKDNDYREIIWKRKDKFAKPICKQNRMMNLKLLLTTCQTWQNWDHVTLEF